MMNSEWCILANMKLHLFLDDAYNEIKTVIRTPSELSASS